MSDTKPCPYCAEDIKAGAIKCKHCHSMLPGEVKTTEHETTSPRNSHKSLELKKPIWKNWWVWVIAVLLVIGVFSSGNNNEDLIEEQAFTSGKRGNTASNIAGGGLAAIQDDWIYFYGYGTNDSINRVQVRDDGSLSEPEPLSKLPKEIKGRCYINVVDDYIYYNQDGLYRMRIDGSELTRLSPESEKEVRYISVIDNYVYYMGEDGYYRMKTDGSGRDVILELHDDKNIDGTKLDETLVAFRSNFNVDGGNIYFVETVYVYEGFTLESDSVYITRTDGTDVTLLHSGNTYVSNLIAENGWVYYLQENEGGSWHNEKGRFNIIKMSNDGANIKKIGEADIGYLNIVENLIYYERYRLQYYPPNDAQQILYAEEYALLRMNLEGQNIESIFNESRTGYLGHDDFDILTMITNRLSTYWPSIAGNWYIYLNEDREVTAKNIGVSIMDTPESTDDYFGPHDGPLDGDPYDVIVDVPENSNLNLRSGPGENYEVIGKLPRGTVLMVMDTARLQTGSTWFEVSAYDTDAKGWVSAKYVRDATEDDFTTLGVGWVELDGLELRSGPGSGFDILEYLAKDTMLFYKYGDKGVESSDTGDLWLEVQTPSGKGGWIQSDYLRESQ